METPLEQATAQVNASGRRRKAMAVIAGGLVLGVGAAITLAAWNDSEFATGSFGSGTFDLEGSTNGTTFSSDLVAPGKTLSFVVDADALSPGDVVAVPFAVQLSADSTYEADLTIEAVSGDPIAADLTYEVVDTGTFVAGCDEATAGTTLVPSAATTESGPTALPSFTATEEPLNLCFVVTAGPDIDQNLTGTVTWEFVGTSTDPLSSE
ncbi:SipW-dependent-type signal peptide-containing protein [Agromyces albus]|uniref:SipW-dependent-type signal peptide-containing protein n=1 Tax=Agromyces albus TaxID=205332 RepID=UPI0027D91979|nr:SipW-dependent-type signal peptide-containing protein [Agromyces albus]